MNWRAVKTVTEYHEFFIVADTYDEAVKTAEDNSICLCESLTNFSGSVIEVESVQEVMADGSSVKVTIHD
tara:strand:- start:1352 stop:1561 length:210 start_codon:yes stop_codon:yes gene_type:complete